MLSFKWLTRLKPGRPQELWSLINMDLGSLGSALVGRIFTDGTCPNFCQNITSLNASPKALARCAWIQDQGNLPERHHTCHEPDANGPTNANLGMKKKLRPAKKLAKKNEFVSTILSQHHRIHSTYPHLLDFSASRRKSGSDGETTPHAACVCCRKESDMIWKQTSDEVVWGLWNCTRR